VQGEGEYCIKGEGEHCIHVGGENCVQGQGEYCVHGQVEYSDREEENIAYKRRILRTRGGYCVPGGEGEYCAQEKENIT
jgi:hypothetical protein